jgi:enolase
LAEDTITRVHARAVLDSRGLPTVEAEVACAGGALGRAIVPSGASTGKYEAVELRDGDPEHWDGKGVNRAIANIQNIIGPAVLGKSAADQPEIDRCLCGLDGTLNKSRLGANSILAVSLACGHAAAASRGLPLWRYLDREKQACLPMPMVNMISGGLHAGGNLDLQDFLLIPIGAGTYSEALEFAGTVYRRLGTLLHERGCEGRLVGDEGGFGPRLEQNELAIELLLQAVEKAGLVPGRDAGIAIDVASSHFYRHGQYHLRGGSARPHVALSSEEMIGWLTRWVNQYPILSIEDGLAEDDWEGWRQLTAVLGRRVQLIGDDLFATNPARLKMGIDMGAANAVLVKMNQIGTLTETLAVLDTARRAGFRAVVSARSGETEDTTMADLAVATGAGQIKIGSVVRSERLAKYNQLLRIEEQMGSDARLARWHKC